MVLSMHDELTHWGLRAVLPEAPLRMHAYADIYMQKHTYMAQQPSQACFLSRSVFACHHIKQSQQYYRSL